jgi:class 3 adenylate cyclase/tetratricopeptide (TPR) repeat protein
VTLAGPSHADLARFVPTALVAFADHREPTARPLDGTLVFADVSGFTALTERLAGRGRVGAEAMSDVINAVFAPMLDLAASLGGELLKYGGDAVLLLFSGADHAARAVEAAVGMRAALRRNAAPRAIAGVRLRMSIGIASGPVELFAVGDRGRELVVIGPTLDRTLDLEHAADAGEILLAPDTAELSSRVARTSPDDRGRLVQRLVGRVAARATRSGAGTEPTDPMVLTSCSPSWLTELVASGAPAEHRVVTIGFVRVSGLGPTLADGSALDRLHRLVSLMQSVADAEGVCFLASDVDVDGLKLVVGGGVPVTRGDDLDRLCLAMSRMVEHVCDQRWAGIEVRAGFQHGTVFAGSVGSPTCLRYSVLGDTVNTAARLMAHAPIGTVVTTEATAALLRASGVDESLPPFHAKGKAEPIRAVTVSPHALGRTGDRRGRLPFLGRDEELSTLVDTIETPGARLRVVAHPGLGKSRLVDEALLRTGDRPVVTVAGGRYAQTSPYRAVRTALTLALGLPDRPDDAIAALARLVRGCRGDLTPWMPLIAVPFGLTVADTPSTLELAAEFRLERMRWAIRTVLPQLLDPRTVIVVEDAHWLDTASADLLDDLARHANAEWSWVVTQRVESTPLDDLPAPTIELGPLDPVAVAGGLSGLDGLDRRGRTRLAEKCQGNPLFLDALLDARRRGADVDQLPDQIEAVVGAQLDALPPATRRIVSIAAVLGMRFPAQLIRAVADADDVDPNLPAAEGVLSVDRASGEIVFRHALLCDTAYERLPVRDRRALHARAAEALSSLVGDAGDRWLSLLAIHHFRGEQWPMAMTLARRAGAAAERDLAHHEALQWYERALTAERRCGAPPSLEVHLARAALFQVLGEFDQADREFEFVRGRLPRADARRATLLGKRAHLDLLRGASLTALRRYRAAEAQLVGPGDRQAACELQSGRGAVLVRLGRLCEARGVLSAARSAAIEIDDRRTLARIDQLLDGVHADLGEAAPMDYGDEALRLYRELGDRSGEGRALNNLAIAAYYAGRWNEAIDHYRAAAAAHEAAGDEAEATTSLVNLAEILLAQGQVATVFPTLDQAIATHRRIGFRVGLGYDLMLRGMAATAVGDFDRATTDLDEATAAFADASSRPLLDEVAVRRTELLAAQGHHADALAAADALLRDDLALVHRAQAHLVRGRCLRAMGRPDAAEQAWATGLADARAASTSLETARLLRALAEIRPLSADERREVATLETSLGLS